MKEFRQTKQLNQQAGFASIVVALVLVLILSLLSVAFAQLSRREQQNSLNKQLSSQAYYAAESGINDVVDAINTGRLVRGKTNVNTSKCLTDDVLSHYGYDTTSKSVYVDGAAAISYSCAIVNLDNPTIEYSTVGKNDTRTIVFKTDAPHGIKSITVYWGSDDGHNTARPAGSKSFLPTDPSSEWGGSPAVLQVGLTKLGSGVNLNRDNLIDTTFNVYLYPGTGGTAAVDYDTTKQGQIISSNGCSAGGNNNCSVTINNLNGGANDYYLLHIINYYDVSHIVIGNAKDSDAGYTDTVKFQDAQADIDVTGRAKNVLKRLRVRYPLIKLPTDPPYAIESQNTCKRIASYPSNPSNNPTDNPYGGPADNACNIYLDRN